MATFRYLKHKTKPDLYGAIWQQTVVVQHIPELFQAAFTTVKDLEKFVDPLQMDPFKDFDYLTIEL